MNCTKERVGIEKQCGGQFEIGKDIMLKCYQCLFAEKKYNGELLERERLKCPSRKQRGRQLRRGLWLVTVSFVLLSKLFSTSLFSFIILLMFFVFLFLANAKCFECLFPSIQNDSEYVFIYKHSKRILNVLSSYKQTIASTFPFNSFAP